MEPAASFDGTTGLGGTSARTPVRRRRCGWAAVVVAGSVLALTGCGDDPNDAPGGSAPPSATVPADEGRPAGSAPQTSGPSAKSADEGHPSTPMATIETTDGG